MLRNSLKVCTNFTHPYRLIRIPYKSLSLKEDTRMFLGQTDSSILNVEVFDCEERILRESYFMRIDLYVYGVAGGVLYCREKAERKHGGGKGSITDRNGVKTSKNRENALCEPRTVDYLSLLKNISSYINDTIADTITKLKNIKNVQCCALFYKLNLIERAYQNAKKNSEVFYMCMVKKMKMYEEKTGKERMVGKSKEIRMNRMMRFIKSMDEDKAVEFVVEIVNDVRPIIANRIVNTLQIKDGDKQRLLFYKTGMSCLRNGAGRLAVRFLTLSGCTGVSEMVDERKWRTAIFGKDYDVNAIAEVLCDEIVRVCSNTKIGRNARDGCLFDGKKGNTGQNDGTSGGILHEKDGHLTSEENSDHAAAMEEVKKADQKLYGDIHRKKIKIIPNNLKISSDFNENVEPKPLLEQKRDDKNARRTNNHVHTLTDNDKTLSNILTDALSVKVNVLTLRQQANDRSVANKLIDNRMLNERVHLKRLLSMCVVVMGRVREMLAADRDAQMHTFEMAGRAGNDEECLQDEFVHNKARNEPYDGTITEKSAKRQVVRTKYTQIYDYGPIKERDYHLNELSPPKNDKNMNLPDTCRPNNEKSTNMMDNTHVKNEKISNLTKALNVIMAISRKQPSYLLPADCVELEVINEEGVHKKTDGLFFSTSALLSKPVYYFLSYVVLRIKTVCRLLCLIFDSTAVNVNCNDGGGDRTIRINGVEGALIGIVVERNGLFYMVKINKLKFVRVDAMTKLRKLQSNRFLVQMNGTANNLEVLDGKIAYERRSAKESVFKVEGNVGSKYKIVYDLNDNYYRIWNGVIEE
ncbi:hypothetical protein THOM_2360 [Trachipleistophora hominis]|uniref:Uncharacterized protein n=1 Tax=Trachipleistophora hominis TaxID=72359 RepID=L7JTJ3_TRAHO|nr:hypothetical protein THOM_2360 [Trachipleistophora hominis]